MEADPSDCALFHRLLERRFGNRRPPVGRVVQLDEHLVRGEVRLVDRVRRSDVVDRQALQAGLLFQPRQGGVHERLMNRLVRFGKDEHAIRCRAGPLRGESR